MPTKYKTTKLLVLWFEVFGDDTFLDAAVDSIFYSKTVKMSLIRKLIVIGALKLYLKKIRSVDVQGIYTLETRQPERLWPWLKVYVRVRPGIA